MFTFVRDLIPSIQPVHDGKSWEGRTYSMFRAVHATRDGYITYVRVCIDGVICICARRSIVNGTVSVIPRKWVPTSALRTRGSSRSAVIFMSSLLVIHRFLISTSAFGSFAMVSKKPHRCSSRAEFHREKRAPFEYRANSCSCTKLRASHPASLRHIDG